MLKKDLKVKLKGKVLKHYVDENKHTLYLECNPSVHEYLINKIAENGGEWKGVSMPCKEDDDGNLYIKVSTSFSIKIQAEQPDLSIANIGIGTEAEIYAILKQGVAKTGKYISAYLSGMIITKFEPFEDYNNPFEDDSYEGVESGEAES